jgi:hypothetical protein
VLSVRVSARALRDLDTRGIADRAVEATNAALARGEQFLAAATAAGTGADDGVEQRLAAFEHRIDATLDQLDRVERRLDASGD